MKEMLRKFLDDTSGATSVEYALIGSLISILVVTACAAIGMSVDGMFQQVAAGFP